MKLCVSFLLFLALCSEISAECPQMREIPTMMTDPANTFTCARVFKGMGGNYPVNGCNSCSYVFANRYNFDNHQCRFSYDDLNPDRQKLISTRKNLLLFTIHETV